MSLVRVVFGSCFGSKTAENVRRKPVLPELKSFSAIALASLFCAQMLCACHLDPKFPGCKKDEDCTSYKHNAGRLYCFQLMCQEYVTSEQCSDGKCIDNRCR
jgi:hypothetical protein